MAHRQANEMRARYQRGGEQYLLKIRGRRDPADPLLVE